MSRFIIRCVMLLIFSATLSYGQDFFEQRYRGWLWFEEKNNDTGIKSNKEESHNDITPEGARLEIEQFAKELEELRFMMLARPTVENIKAYRDKESKMWQQAEKLHAGWNMANFLYPQQRDLINNPVNVHAVKTKRTLMQEEDTKKIRELAGKFDLVLFFSNGCKYCQLLSPVLKDFAAIYGFKVEAISIDGEKHEYFRTVKAPELIESLGISAFPTVIAISNDSKTAFELIRGYVSISELEEYSLLSIKYLESLEDKQPNTSFLISDGLAE